MYHCSLFTVIIHYRHHLKTKVKSDIYIPKYQIFTNMIFYACIYNFIRLSCHIYLVRSQNNKMFLFCAIIIILYLLLIIRRDNQIR